MGEFPLDEYFIKKESDEKRIAELRAPLLKQSIDAIPKNIKRLALEQTYSLDNLDQTFDIRVNEGLLAHLEQYLELEPGENNTYRLVGLKETVPAEIRSKVEISHNKMVPKVIEALKTVYGTTDSFLLQTQNLPQELRAELAPGLLPEILEYLVDTQILERVPRKRYRFTKENK